MSLKKLLPLILLICLFAGILHSQNYLSYHYTYSISYRFKPIRELNFPEDEGYRIYQQARRLIYRKDWQKAVDKLYELIDKYPESRYVDASYYWLGYCFNRLGMKEEAFKNLKYLANNFPHSPWKDDAQMLMVEIAEMLVRQGELEYSRYLIENINREMKNAHVRLMSLNSLLNLKKEMLQHEKAFQDYEKAMKKTLKQQATVIKEREEYLKKLNKTLKTLEVQIEPDIVIKKSDKVIKIDTPKFVVNEIVRQSLDEGFIESTAFILSHHFKEKSIPVIVDIALKDPDLRVRSKAVLLIAQVGGEKSFEPLLRIYETTEEPLIKQNIVISFGQILTVQSVKELGHIAKHERNSILREQACIWLGKRTCQESLRALANAYYAQKSAKLKERIIYFIGQRGNESAQKYLTKIANKEKNKQLKDYAHFWIKQIDNKKAIIYIPEQE